MQAEPLQQAASAATAPYVPRLLHGDCLALLPGSPDDSVDLLCIDPPYGINYKSLSHSLPKTTITNDGPEAYPLLQPLLKTACCTCQPELSCPGYGNQARTASRQARRFGYELASAPR